jgi:hypothetical protein
MNLKHPRLAALALTVLLSSLVTPLALLAQDESKGSPRVRPANPKTGSVRTTAPLTGRRSPRTGSLDKRKTVRRGTSKGGNTTTKAGAMRKGAAADDGSAAKSGSKAEDKSDGSLRDFVKGNYGWILGVLGVSLLGVVSWIFLGARRKRRGEHFLEPLDDELEAASPRSSKKRSKSGGFSSTRIRASDVNSRLSGGMTTEEVETDREYAFVIDEADLRQKEVDEHTGREYAEEGSIRECLRSDDLDGAWVAYTSAIERDGTVEFHVEVEKELSEHFLSARDYSRAARVLEHHVATHAAEDVDPDTYFNLGYIHFQTKTVNKSRRFFKLFVENDRRPDYVARARRILAGLEDGSSQN